MTRAEAIGWQHDLFPPRRSDILPPSLCEIALNLQHALNETRDPWPLHEVMDARDMLQARLDTWSASVVSDGVRSWDLIIDTGVWQMVVGVVAMANWYIRTERLRYQQSNED